jgi:hypothetical protein
MSKNKDLVLILLIVIIGMFIPFLGSLLINFNLNIQEIDSWYTIGSTFGYFLLIFAIELIAVLGFFTASNRFYSKKLKK